MSIAAMVIGIIAGLIGLFVTGITTLMGLNLLATPQLAFDSEITAHARSLFGQIVLVDIISCLLGFLGAGLAAGKPRVGSVLMTFAAAGLFYEERAMAMVASPLFLIAALLAFIDRPKNPQVETRGS